MVEALVEALDEQLREGETLDRLSIAWLARRAGVGIGSFYEYFANKDALLAALIETATRRNYEELRAHAEAGEDLDGLCRRLTLAVATTYVEHPARMRAIFLGVGKLGLLPIVVAERDRFAGELFRASAPHLPDVDEARLRATMVTICDCAIGMVGGALYREPAPTVEAFAEELHRMTMAQLEALR